MNKISKVRNARNLRASEIQDRLDRLNVLLKMFDYKMTVGRDEGNPHNGSKTWKKFPFRLYMFVSADDRRSIAAYRIYGGSEWYAEKMFGTLEELERHVHGLLNKGANPEPEPEPEYCSTCENGGWVLSSFQARHPPNFEECPDCYNPNDYPCP